MCLSSPEVSAIERHRSLRSKRLLENECLQPTRAYNCCYPSMSESALAEQTSAQQTCTYTRRNRCLFAGSAL